MGGELGKGVVVVWYIKHDLLEKFVHVQLGSLQLGCSVWCVCECVCMCMRVQGRSQLF